MNPALYTTRSPKYKFDIYTAINFTRYSVTQVGALCAAGWAWSLQWLGMGAMNRCASTGGVLVTVNTALNCF